jgi:tetratricopeptide (TPR) repeat protein
LLILTGSYEDAAKAFSNANSLRNTIEAEYQKAKCHMLLGDLDGVLKSLGKIKELNDNDTLVDFDSELLSILKQASTIQNASDREAYSKCLYALTKLLSGKGEICKPNHVHFFRGVLLFYMRDYVKAGAEFRAALGPRDLVETYISSGRAGEHEDQNDVLFNLSMCYAMKEEYENAAVTLQETIYTAEGSNKGQLLFLLGLLQLAMEQHIAAKELMMEAFKFDPETISAYLDDQEAIEVLPLNCSDPLSKQFPMIKVSFGSSNPIVRYT